MKTLKTSTKISFNFVIYFLIILIFSISVNFYYFYSWINHSHNEIIETLDREYTEVYTKDETLKTPAEKFEKFKEDVFDVGGYIIDGSGHIFLSEWYASIPKTNVFSVFQKNGKSYLIGGKQFPHVGSAYLFYDTFSLYESQQTLLKSSIIMLVIFSILGFLFSEYLIHSSLKNLQTIASFARNLDFDNLTNTLHIVGREDDEIKIVATALNKAIAKINYKAQKLKDFSSDVAHEFKTSLMIVNSAIDYSTESRRYKDGFLNIKVQVKFLDYLISALLSMSRLEWKSLKRKVENIGEMVEKSFHEIDAVFKAKGLKGILKIEDEEVLHRVDKSLFSIVINNLIFNAYKFTSSWEIRITLTKNYLEVRDSGIGIKAENIPKIWTRHYREDNTWNSNGHGLGLSLVREIVDRHAFRIEVESEVDVGSTFRVYFQK